MSRSARFRILSFVLTAGAAAAAADVPQAGGVDVRVSDENGEPVGHVAIYVESVEPRPARGGLRPKAVMDQHDHAFVPHILVVETGTDIEFPNSDSVSHHVYSFSRIKKFALPLYKGRQYPPERFDVPGLVTLGCNIHDDMLGYILVVDTPHFTLTDAAGVARLDGLMPGRYTVHAWTPRLRDAHLPEPIAIDVGRDGRTALDVRFSHKLFPPHEHGDSSLSWSNY
jgi:plastocyanin